MPLHDLGYRAWKGKQQSAFWRWWVIAETGIRLAWKSNWLRRMLLIAWLPASYFGVTLFLYERSEADSRVGLALPRLLTQLEFARDVPWGESSPEARHEVWAFILLTLFRYPQGVLMLLLVGLLAPPLIARDIRSRAYLLYFSRPIGRGDYVFGKSVVLWFFLSLITTAPAMALYVFGVFLSPDLSVIWDTWDLPLRVLLASMWLIVPTTAMSLCFSSLTVETRYAAFAWFAVWVLGWVAYSTLSLMASLEQVDFSIVSLYHSLGVVQSWVFGLEENFNEVRAPMAILIGVTVFSLIIFVRRVSSPADVR